MKFNLYFVFSLAILATLVSSQSTGLPGIRPVIRTTKATTTTEVPTTSSTTEAPSSTTEASTTSTTTSTTEAPTTSAPTTSTTTTTTAPPDTTTVAPITSTTPAPPTPNPSIGKWNLTDAGNVCVIVNAAIQLKIPYVTNDNVSRTALYNIPAELSTVLPGVCGNETNGQFIQVQWGPKSSPSNFLMLFAFNSTTHEYSLKEFEISLNQNELPNGQNKTYNFFYTQQLFAVPKGMSYHCNKNQTLELTDDEKSNKTVAWAFVSHQQLEAFHKGDKAQFSYAKDCDAIDTPDIVPIAVGCALIALVVVVLIAYLVGRRRAQSRGYISM